MPSNRKILRSGFFLTCVIILLSWECDAAAQRLQRPQRYEPARPTISPYLNLLRENVSPIPNYYSLVRPQLQQQRINQQQQSLLIRQNSEIRQLQTNLLRTQAEGPVSGTPSWFQNPGSRSTFLNTSQYYGRVGTRP